MKEIFKRKLRGSNSGGQLLQAVGLGHVVVAPGHQALDLVVHLVQSGKEDDGRVRKRARRLADGAT